MSEERYHKLNSQKLISLAFQKRAQDEIKMYTSKSSSDKSFRYISSYVYCVSQFIQFKRAIK
jgi:hypothetical protein